jgi:hypothetical protein
MNKVIVLYGGVSPQVYDVIPPNTAEQIASQSFVTSPSLYQEFPSTDFDEGCYLWPNAFTLSAGIVGFDLATAKLTADGVVRQQSVAVQTTLLDGYTAEQVAAQAALASASRDVRFQTIINDLNVETADTLQKQTDIASATTIAEVNAIVYP